METCSATTREESGIQATEMRVLRLMVGRTRKERIRIERIRKSIGVEPINQKIDVARLRWLGHVWRMQEGRETRGRGECRPRLRRPRGRQMRDEWSQFGIH